MDTPYLHESVRLLTFLTYPQDADSSAIILASQGFVYVGRGRQGEVIVQCIFCLSVVYDVKENNIGELHVHLNQMCPMMRGLDCGNIPIGAQGELFFNPNLGRPHLPFERNRCVDGRIRRGTIGPLPIFSAAVPGTSTYPRQGLPHSHGSQRWSWERAASWYWQQATDVDVRSSSNATSEEGQQDTLLGSFGAAAAANTTNFSCQSSVREQSSGHLPRSQGGQLRSLAVASEGTIDYSQQPPSRGAARTNCGEDMGIIYLEPNMHGFYSDEQRRLDSFVMWPRGHPSRPEDLARAGYFYTGCYDCIRCFYCGIGCRGFAPWVTHVRYRPHCPFLQLTLGKAFIEVARDLCRHNETVVYDDVLAEMRTRGLEHKMPEAEHRQLADRMTCQLCNARNISVVFLPCGHLISCDGCALSGAAKCPECQKPILAVVPVRPS